MNSKKPSYLNVLALAAQAGLDARFRLSDAAWARCVKDARDVQVVCRRIIEALLSQIGIAGLKSSRSKGARYSVDVATNDGEAPDIVDLHATLRECDGMQLVHVGLRREVASEMRRKREAERQSALTLMLTQSRNAIHQGYLVPIVRVHFFPPECLDGRELWIKSEGADAAGDELRTELYVSESTECLAPLIEKLRPFLTRHEGGLITCGTGAEAAVLTQILNDQFGTGKGERFRLGSYPNTAEGRTKSAEVRHAMSNNAIEFVVATQGLKRKFLPSWTLWIDLCRWTSPLMFRQRLQELCRLCVRKCFAEAVTFQVVAEQQVEEQIILCDAIRDGFFGSPGIEDAAYRDCLDRRWAQLISIQSRQKNTRKSYEPLYLDLSKHAKEAGLPVQVRLSYPAWNRCVVGARDEDLVRWDLVWMLCVQIKIEGPEPMRIGLRYSVALDLNNAKDFDSVELLAIAEEYDGGSIIRIRLPFEN